MTSQQSITITTEDVQSVAQKLEAFRRDLPPGQQAALERLLQEAMAVIAGGNDVQGYSLSTLPVPEGDVLKAFELA